MTALLEILGRPAVAAEREGCFQDVYEEQLGDPSTHHLVAESDGELVGFCSLHFRSRLNQTQLEAWIPDLVVAPAARRQGVAQALLEAAVSAARDRHCHQLTLESGYARRDAHRLYERFGMTDAGKQFGMRLGGGLTSSAAIGTGLGRRGPTSGQTETPDP